MGVVGWVGGWLIEFVGDSGGWLVVFFFRQDFSV